MARVQPIFSSDHCPPSASVAMKAEVASLFATLFPGQANPAFDENHAGMAVAAQSPQLALALSQASMFMAGALPFSQNRTLRELVIQTVNRALACDYAFQARIGAGEAAGLARDVQEALGTDRAASLLDDQQYVTSTFAAAVVRGTMDDALYARAVAHFGDQGAVELTTLAAFFGFWAQFITATDAGNGDKTHGA